MSKRVKSGDVVGIPLGEMGVAVAIVLHVSKRFRGAMMIGICDRLYEDVLSIDLGDLPREFIATPNYTGTRLVTNGRWKRLGHSRELLDAVPVPELRMAYSIYYKDEVRRQIALAQFRDYTELAVQGGQLVEHRIRQHFAPDSVAAV